MAEIITHAPGFPERPLVIPEINFDLKGMFSLQVHI